EAADHRRHHHEEHHDEAVRGDDDVVELMVVMEQRIAWLHQIDAHDDREGAADQRRGDREDDVKRADVLVVGREQPARNEGRLVIVVAVIGRAVRVAVGMIGRVGHAVLVTLSKPLYCAVRSAYRTAVAASSLCANFFLASASHLANSSFETACTSIGMKGWLLPQIWLHSP